MHSQLFHHSCYEVHPSGTWNSDSLIVIFIISFSFLLLVSLSHQLGLVWSGVGLEGGGGAQGRVGQGRAWSSLVCGTSVLGLC